jgi:hypothetical protein
MTTTKQLPARLTIRAAGDEPEITITTPATDLMGDTIDPDGMDVTSYLNGTRAVNVFHDHGRLPIGKTLSLRKSSTGIRAKFRWLEANPEARVVRDVFEQGVLGASVEFVPVDVRPKREGGYEYVKSVLTGWALTANPANPECVRRLKSLGLVRAKPRDDDAEDIDLDGIVIDDEDVLELDDEHDEEDILQQLSARDVAALVREVVASEVRTGVRRAIAAARGRID